MRKCVLAALLALLPINAASADDYSEANKSSAFMAAITVCKASISQERKRVLYASILRIYETPSQVNFMISQEVSALNKMPTQDRDAMCSAINDRIKTSGE